MPDEVGGDIKVTKTGEDWEKVTTRHASADGDCRILGVADMAHAIREGRLHRASGALAHHVLEVMEAFTRSCESGGFATTNSWPERPMPMPEAGFSS